MFPESNIIRRPAPPEEVDLDSAIEQLRQKFKVPRALVERMVHQESGGNTEAKSYAGAKGMFQVMPKTLEGISRETGKRLDINNPLDNAYAGLYLLNQNYNRFRPKAKSERGAWMMAVAGYHGNPENVDKDLARGGLGIPNQGDGLINTRDHVYRIFAGTKPEDFGEPSAELPTSLTATPLPTPSPTAEPPSPFAGVTAGVAGVAPPQVITRPQRRPQRSIGFNDLSWHLGMDDAEFAALSPGKQRAAARMARQAAANDDTKKAAGHQLTPSLSYINANRAVLGLPAKSVLSARGLPTAGPTATSRYDMSDMLAAATPPPTNEPQAGRGIGELRRLDEPETARILRIQREVAEGQRTRRELARQEGNIVPAFDQEAEVLRRVAAERAAEAPAEIARRARVARMSTQEYLAQAPKSIATGLADAAGSSLKGIAALSRKINLGDEYKGRETTDLATYKLGEQISQGVRDLVGSNPDLEAEMLVGQGPAVIGQLGSFMLGGWATKAPRLATTILGMGMTAGDAYDEVRAIGGSDADAVNSALLAGGLLGPTELIGMRGAMKALKGTAKEATWRGALLNAAREGRRDVVENFLQEFGQEFGQGEITGQSRSPSQLLTAGALGAVGGTATVPLTLARTTVAARKAMDDEVAEGVSPQPVAPEVQPQNRQLGGRGALDADQVLAQREAAVKPIFLRDDQGKSVARVLNPEEVAQGAKPKVRAIHQADTQARDETGKFTSKPSVPAEPAEPTSTEAATTTVASLPAVSPIKPEDIHRFVDESVASKTNEKKVLSLGSVSPANVAAVKEAAGVDLGGYERVIDNYSARHLVSAHADAASELSRGQLPVTTKDIALIPSIVETPDMIENAGKTRVGREGVRYVKRINGAVYYVEEVRNRQKQVVPVSMIKRRSGGSERTPNPEPPSYGRTALQPKAARSDATGSSDQQEGSQNPHAPGSDQPKSVPSPGRATTSLNVESAGKETIDQSRGGDQENVTHFSAKSLQAKEVITRSNTARKGEENVTPTAEAKPSSTVVTSGRPLGAAASNIPAEPSTTAAKKASMSADRVELDLPELPAAERKAWQKTLDQAKAKGTQNAGVLADEVIAKPRPLNDVETGQLVLRAQEIKNDHSRVMKEIGVESDPEVIKSKRIEADALQREFDKITEATKKSGTEKGRALASQKLTINQDYDPVSIMQRTKAMRGRELKPEERQKIEEQATRISELETKLVAAQKEAEAKAIQKDIERVKRQVKRGETKQVLDDEFAMLRSEFAQARIEIKSIHGSGLAGLDPEGKLTPIILKMARNRVKAGITEAAKVVDAVYAAAREHIEGISRDDVQALLAGHDLERDPLPAIKKRLRGQQADLTRRLEEKDYSQPPPRKPVVYDREASNLKARVEQLKRKIDADIRGRDSILETILNMRKAGLLTGPKTHIRNIGGNFAFQAFEEAARVPGAIADLLPSVFTGRRALGLPSPVAVAKSSYEAATKGVREAVQIMKYGGTAEDMAKMELPREANSGSKLIDAYQKTVFRTLGAEDKIAKTAAYRRSIEDQAGLRAKEFGRTKKDLAANPPAEMVSQAILDAEVATFNNPNKAAEGIEWVRRRSGPIGSTAIDLILPFKRTPANIASRLMESTPLGLARAGGQLVKAAINKEMSFEDQRKFSQTVGRSVTGSSLILLGYTLASKGLATGLSEDDRGDREAQKASGRSPLSVKVGDNWHQIGAFSPIGNLIAIGAALHREHTKPLKEGEERGSIVGEAAPVAAKVLLEQPFLKGASGVVDAVQNPGNRGTSFLAQTVSSFVPTAVSDVGATLDDKRRDSRGTGVIESIQNKVQSKIPILRRSLPEDVDVFGRPLESRRTAAIDPTLTTRGSNDPFIKELVRLDVGIVKTNKKQGEDEAKHRERVIAQGKEMAKELTKLVEMRGYQSADDDGKREMIKSTVEQVRKAVNEHIKTGGKRGPREPRKPREVRVPYRYQPAP